MLRTPPPSVRRLALCNGPDVALGEGCKTEDTRIRAATSGGLSSLASAVCGGSTLPDTPRHGTHAVRGAHHRAGVVQATTEVQDAFCAIEVNHAKILGYGMRSCGSLARITSATLVAPQRHAVEARVHGMHAS